MIILKLENFPFSVFKTWTMVIKRKTWIESVANKKKKVNVKK